MGLICYDRLLFFVVYMGDQLWKFMGCSVPAVEVQQFHVDQDLYQQLMLLGLRDVVAVGVLDKNNQLVEVMNGLLEPRVVDDSRWARNNFTGLGAQHPRHGFLVDLRENMGGFTAHRNGDVYVRPVLADTLEGVTHPAIICVMVKCFDDVVAVLDSRRGSYPKAIRDTSGMEENEQISFDKRVIKKYLGLEKKWLKELIDRFDPNPLTCSFAFATPVLTAAWDLPEDIIDRADFIFTADSITEIDDHDLRSLFVHGLMIDLFKSKFPESDDHTKVFSPLKQAYLQKTIGRFERWVIPSIFRFQRDEDGKLQICLDFHLIGHVPGGGPKGGSKLPLSFAA